MTDHDEPDDAEHRPPTVSANGMTTDEVVVGLWRQVLDEVDTIVAPLRAEVAELRERVADLEQRVGEPS